MCTTLSGREGQRAYIYLLFVKMYMYITDDVMFVLKGEMISMIDFPFRWDVNHDGDHSIKEIDGCSIWNIS